MMVGTLANGGLAQLRNEWCRDRGMKPLKEDQQLRSLSRSHSVARQALKPKSSHEEEGAWMQAPISRSHGRSGEVFLLDILSHRMSALAGFATANLQEQLIPANSWVVQGRDYS